MEHNYCFVPKVSPQRNNQVNGLAPTSNVTSGQTCIVSPTVSQTQYNVVTNNNRGKLNLFYIYYKITNYILYLNNLVIQKPLSNPNNVPISDLLPSIAKHEPQIQVESELSASDHDLDGQGEETDTAPEAVAEGKDNVKSEEPAVTRCIWLVKNYLFLLNLFEDNMFVLHCLLLCVLCMFMLNKLFTFLIYNLVKWNMMMGL